MLKKCPRVNIAKLWVFGSNSRVVNSVPVGPTQPSFEVCLVRPIDCVRVLRENETCTEKLQTDPQVAIFGLSKRTIKPACLEIIRGAQRHIASKELGAIRHYAGAAHVRHEAFNLRGVESLK